MGATRLSPNRLAIMSASDESASLALLGEAIVIIDPESKQDKSGYS